MHILPLIQDQNYIMKSNDREKIKNIIVEVSFYLKVFFFQISLTKNSLIYDKQKSNLNKVNKYIPIRYDIELISTVIIFV